MSSPYSVQIHQDNKAPSIGSAYSNSSVSYLSSSSGSSTPRSISPGEYREHGAAKHASSASSSGRNIVINHHKVGWDVNSPQVGSYVAQHPRR
ncbi:hypothetical protein AK830_g11882 [Neonectria ditissima]|uniref:Uncharacterized protein n=1 Tax=Neonectria ditissima TaxID=78410 RepID=A0A0P7B4D3_9HYPO|nr:hypothetical protein AK830_g11882 [Neonectria ditissima]